ncbi:hypothetical protein B0T17DRAFT_540930 [Bombardia bombarda]|uniref:Uncharacterized protein n=1 Tax=Bombardia bombarda TaxID=252184 RepID=A0AA39WGQ4_9PEZI|nr:hypothetical protein B0T17DRAFT_540930 [Bombardia bombarda]
MSTNRVSPGAGQKVTPTNPPTTQESAGAIDASSLAAESIRSGGAFSSNRGAIPGSSPAQDDRKRAPGQGGTSASGTLANQESYGGVAPSYVNSAPQDHSGPHGRNLTEGGFAGSGTAGGRLPEPGSKQDPSRMAELKMGLTGGKGMGSGTGRSRREGGQEQGDDWEVETERGFEALKRDEEA